MPVSTSISAATPPRFDQISIVRGQQSLVAHKFGGSSLADALQYRHVATLLRDTENACRQIVAVSAMQGVTNGLIALAERGIARADWREAWSQLRQQHLDAGAVLDPEGAHGLCPWIVEEFDALRGRLEGIAPSAGLTLHEVEGIQGLGEVWSARLLLAALGGEGAGWTMLDAREVLIVHPGELGVAVDWDDSRNRLAEWRSRHTQPNVVVTGYVARDAQGRATTLGRNGSDFSGAIFAALFDAEELTIWTDVDGVLSADPRLVPDAVCLPRLSYAEACELAYFGASVLHPQTMAPVQSRGIPLRIRNTRRPESPGTLIGAHAGTDGTPVKGLSLIRDLAVLELIGNGMVGVPGTAERLFAALHGASVSVTMISQGSSEHSICCIVRGDQAERGRTAIVAAFAEAMADGQTQNVVVTQDIAVLAAVGDGMVGTPGVAARLLGGIAQARVNVRAIAQGASERNISVAIADRDATRALRAAHSAFWLSPQTLSVGIIGPGHVGRALLSQLAATLPGLRALGPSAIDLRIRGICDSRRMLLSDSGIEPARALDGLRGGDARTLDFDAFTAHIRAEHMPHALIVDCSASDTIAEKYADWLAAGIHVVTPNKHAGSGDWQRYAAIGDAQKTGGRFLYEATVGAGLPVILTLRNLLDTGDELHAIDGMLSGTLAWLFNRFDGSQPFSALVREAMALGYTEPDPRDDLSGRDVARKLVILAREAGRELSIDDVEVESLVPASLRKVSREEFLGRLDELDAPMQARLNAATAQGLGLRHIARLERDGRASVGVTALPADHACRHAQLTDNLVQYRTARYSENALVVQGPGAGPQVTAAGVFADVLAIAKSLGGRL
ncbi:MAG: bifunctional aspartate kinase/homoserine dehydrogenase I [Lysobacterales bacterium]